MSDEHLRELERRYRESPTREHELEWLVASLQSGAVPRPRVQLAARLGYPPARAALAQQVDLDASSWVWTPALKTWNRKVGPLLDRESAARLGHSAARRAVGGDLERWLKSERRPRQALQALAAWIVAPPASRPERATALQAALSSLAAVETLAERLDDGGIYAEYHDARTAAIAALRATRAAIRTTVEQLPGPAALEAVACSFSSSDTEPHRATRKRTQVEAEHREFLLGFVARDLVPWLCGTRDPVQEWLAGG